MLKRLIPCALLALFGGAATAQTTAQTTVPISCILMPLRESRIGVEQGGIVTAREVRRNDVVKAGDVLVRLQDGILQADLDRTLHNHQALQTRLMRSESLTKNNLITQDEIEKLRAETAIAEAEVGAARQKLANTRILAPFDGVISATSIEAGEMASANAPLLTLVDIAQLRAVVIFPVEAWGQSEPGREIEVSALVGGVKRMGRVQAIDRFVDAAANSFTLEILLDNQDFAMPAGSGCQL